MAARRELWVQIRSEGEQMQGRLVSKQTDVDMKLKVDHKYSQTRSGRCRWRKSLARSTASKSMRTLPAPGATWT